MGDWAFEYDTLNRLTGLAGADNVPSAYLHTLGCWGYDSFGNRTLNAYVTASDCKTTTTATASYNANNRMTSVSQAAPISYMATGGFTYDAAEDVTVDGQNMYAYDAEGRICAVYNGISHAYTRYVYDAAGLRVAKAGLTWIGSGQPNLALACGAPVSNSSWTFNLSSQYLLDAGGDQATELDGLGNWVHSNVWAGAHLDATYDLKGPHFHLADPLGTRRVQTNISGQIEATFQSLPFGDGFLYTSTGLSTSDDATENHFTGKERDSESGNDYFGARYYASSMGRFMSPDWSAKVEPVPYSKLDDPQTLNLYAYVTNNPLTRRDLDGHCGGYNQATGQIYFAPDNLKHPVWASAPTLPDGSPRPPSNPPPGGGNWKWFPDPRRWNASKNRWEGNKRGGTWGPEKWDTKNGPRPSASWDDNPGPNGKEHWDIDDGQGNSHKEDEDGKPMTDDEAHGRSAPQQSPQPGNTSSPFSDIGDWASNHKGALIAAGVVAGAILLAPETGGASLVFLGAP